MATPLTTSSSNTGIAGWHLEPATRRAARWFHGGMGLAVIGVVAGIYHRHRSETHKRLMLLAMVSMLPPSISRWPIAVKRPAPVIVGIMLAFLAAAPISDLLSRPRQSLASLWGGLAVLLSLPLRFALAQTAA